MGCVVCNEPGPGLCSWSCLRSASAELEANMGALRLLQADDSARRYELAARNGELTSALVRCPKPPKVAS